MWAAIHEALTRSRRVTLALRSDTPSAPLITGTPRVLAAPPDGVTRLVIEVARGVEYSVDLRTIARVEDAD